MTGYRTQTSLRFQWTDGACDGNAAVTRFTLYYKRQGDTSERSMLIEPYYNEVELTGLSSGQSYSVRITSTNSNGESQTSNTVSGTTSQNIVISMPPSPINVGDNEEERTLTTMRLVWE